MSPAEAADQVGAATLERMAAAPRYNRWMFDRLRPPPCVPPLRPWPAPGAGAWGPSRRYAAAERAENPLAAGSRLRHLEYFTLAGVPGWWVAGRVLRRRLIPAGALRWYEALVPLFRLERLLPWRIGQSLIAIGEVPA